MNIFNELPDDIKNLILNKYLLYPQDKTLLEDIRNYKKNKILIYKIYEKKGYEYNCDYTDEFNIYSAIDNDLMAYWNDDVAYDNGIVKKNFNKMIRILSFKIKYDKENEKAVYNFHMNCKIPLESKINRYIGGLNINERNKFINLLKNPID
jgi:hypothetical protein|tara:strand:- start:1336 stop:1788 length:453 start_codon:yes stop_codon:yes gene_type:complete